MINCKECSTKTHNKLFCSSECALKGYQNSKRGTGKTYACLNCNTISRNKKYCSQKCSAISTNKNRKKKTYYCKKCNDILSIGYTGRTTCNSCKNKRSYRTLKELRQKYDTNDYHSIIRADARSIYKKSKNPYVCYNCNYSVHVQICHIKPIADFEENDTIIVINDISNLVALCPNCHWEFDNGYLKL